jgi:hypothetical protein
MRTRIMTILGGLLVAAGLSIAIDATPALASNGPVGYVSFWDGCNGGANPTAGYCGAAWAFPASQIGVGVCHSVPVGSNDRWSAFSNNDTGRNITVWTAGGCTGSVATLYNGTETGQIDSPFNNTISSWS